MRESRTRFLLAVLISAIAVSGQQVVSGGSSPADILYAQPGQLVSVNGFRLNLHCMGSGSPTVVFDSGWEDWAPAWSKVQPEVAKWTRACSYDRAGTGFSDPGPMPRTSVHIAEELRTARRHGGIGGPYILVGRAFGGDNVRTFADLFMGEVAGLEPVIRPNHQERFLSSAGSCCRKMVEFVARGDPSAYANVSG